jgi:glycerol uptake facilitator-like aquaporin
MRALPPLSSGIMGERLAGGNVAIALLANTIATGTALVVLILTFGPISGAHFNPAVTLVDAIEGGLCWIDAAYYAVAQCGGAVSGTIVTHLMYNLQLISFSQHARSGGFSIIQ